ncbi:Transmembrane 9 superfamily member 7 [Sesamum angolense]|uniref:Transmembrane 9 superfamily member n=1 Tax=Sesamum angolense TaxID=2727404 RepID=A0AAE2C672_9LAMI|nr:Transmembrane 9 superfamily member 7 [Sesamum angolense]
MTAMVLLWVFMGLFAGYSSARLYKMFKGTEWKRNTLKTAFMFPGILFAVFFVLNALIWGEKSSGAVPFGTMFALVCLWFGISVPLVFIGSYLGFKKPVGEDPVKTNKIPRQIPEQACLCDLDNHLCAEITIVLCYFQLCSEDYNWWWRAYLTAGSSALYLFFYSIFYFFTKLEITKLVSGILYFGYMLIASYAFFVLTGTIGFYACFWFVRKIYSSVKID